MNQLVAVPKKEVDKSFFSIHKKKMMIEFRKTKTKN